MNKFQNLTLKYTNKDSKDSNYDKSQNGEAIRQDIPKILFVLVNGNNSNEGALNSVKLN